MFTYLGCNMGAIENVSLLLMVCLVQVADLKDHAELPCIVLPSAGIAVPT